MKYVSTVIYLLFFLIAWIYSSAGFGGGSMYVAILSQWQWPTVLMQLTSLICNTAVTSWGTLRFIWMKYVHWVPSLSLLACSIPVVLWTGSYKLKDSVYFILLAFCLLAAAGGMLIQKKSIVSDDVKPKNSWWHYPLSAVIGALAGFTGIGGGIYLSPVLHLTSWGSPRAISATSSLYILVNSLVALYARRDSIQLISWHEQWLLIAAVLAGAFIGSTTNLKWLSPIWVRRMTVFVISFVAIKLLWDQWM